MHTFWRNAFAFRFLKAILANIPMVFIVPVTQDTFATFSVTFHHAHDSLTFSSTILSCLVQMKLMVAILHQVLHMDFEEVIDEKDLDVLTEYILPIDQSISSDYQ